MKTTLSTLFLQLFFLLFFFTLLCFPSDTLQGASIGLLLWFNTILPTLLPTMILADFLLKIGADRYVTRLAARPLGLLLGLSKDGCYGVLVGLLCGYPMGAKTTASLWYEKRISRQEANYLLAFSNQPSPMFLIGYLCLGLFADYDGNQLILPLLFSIYGSAFLISILYRASLHMYHTLQTGRQVRLSRQTTLKGSSWKKTFCDLQAYPSTHSKSADLTPLSLLESSMMTSFEVMVKIGGYMMLFSIAETYIEKLPVLNATHKSLLMGFIEITTGSRQIAAFIDLPWALILCGSVTAFGGLSGFAQTAHVLQDSGLSIKSYFLWKILQGVLAGALILLYCYLKLHHSFM